MRPIKFRVWDKTRGKMALVWRVVFDYGNALCIDEFDHNRMDDTQFELMQFTGLLDCSNKEIYEGDIVTYFHPAEYDLPAIASRQVIAWNEDTAGFELGMITHRLSIDHEVEVIGNIYESPGLIQRREEA